MSKVITEEEYEGLEAAGRARRIPPVRMRDDPSATNADRLAVAEGLARRINDAEVRLLGRRATPFEQMTQTDRNMAIAIAADVLSTAPQEADRPASKEMTDAETHALTIRTARALVLNSAVAAHNLVLRAGKDSEADGPDDVQPRVYLADAAKIIAETMRQAIESLEILQTLAPVETALQGVAHGGK